MARLALITGAHGFIGRHAARHLARQGWRVIGLGHGTWARDEYLRWGVSEWHSTDVTFDALVTYGTEPDLILHCAGSGSVGFSLRHPFQDFHRTVTTTLCVLEFARLHAPASSVVFTSSVAVYGGGALTDAPITESSPLCPISPYGVHKKLAEELCRSYAHHFGLRAIIVRIFSAYGAGLRKQLLWDAALKLQIGDVTFSGTGSEVRDWIHVEDISALLFQAGDRASDQCPVVNAGSGVGTTVREILTKLFGCLGRTDAPIFSSSARPGDPVFYRADSSLARSWGWRPLVSLSEGIQEYARWFLGGCP